MQNTIRRLAACASAASFLLTGAAWADLEPWRTTRYPQDEQKWWWDDAWWNAGHLPGARNYSVQVRDAAYRSGDTEVPVRIYAPAETGVFPVVVFLHGRRGVDELTRLIPLRLAARGFTVVGPDLYSGRFIDKYPIAHDPVLERDAAGAIDFALTLAGPQRQGKVCVASHTRGGYYALKALTTHGRQAQAACYLSWYPHWQDPNAPEPMQVYQYAPEVDALSVPVLVFFGEQEQYQRYRPILTGIQSLKDKKREPRLIVYPGVGRGFDFRPREVRTLADDLAAQDSLRRAATFIRQHTR